MATKPNEMMPYDFEQDPFTAPYRTLRDPLQARMAQASEGLREVASGAGDLMSAGAGAVNRGIIQPMAKGMAMDFQSKPTATMPKVKDPGSVLPPIQAQTPSGPPMGAPPGNPQEHTLAPSAALYGGAETPDVNLESLRIPQQAQSGSAKAMTDLNAMFAKAVEALGNPNLSPNARKGIGDLLTVQKGLVDSTMLQEGRGKGQTSPFKLESVAPGQTMMRFNQQTGQVEPIGQAPEAPGAAAGRMEKAHDTRVDNASKLYLPFKKAYDKKWDDITETVPEGPERTKALYNLNREHFMQQSIPEDLAGIPESFKLFVEMVEPKGTTITQERKKQLEGFHRGAIKQRNQMLKKFWSDALQFSSNGEY